MQKTLLAASAVIALCAGAAPALAGIDHSVDTRVTGPRGETERDAQNDASEPGFDTVSATITLRKAPSQMFIQAATSSHIDIFPKQVASSQVIENLAPGGVKGLSEASGVTTSTYRDTLTLNGSAAQAGMMVTLHNTMLLRADNVSETLFHPTAPGDFTFADTRGDLAITGTGIGPAPFGVADFMTFEHHYRNSTAFSSSDGLPPTTIDFALNLVVGQATDLSITQVLNVSSDLEDLFGGADPVLSVIQNWQLVWGDNFFVTADDAQGHDTGRRVAGLTSTSASGFQFLAAQAGGVPEPAAWALMIAGFGLAGGRLRRRREACPG